MKRFFTLALLFTFQLVVAFSASIVWGYCDEGKSSYPNNTQVGTYSAAICLGEVESYSYAGSEIKAVSLCLTHNVTDLSVFVTTDLKDLSKAQVIGSATDGWHEYALNAPVKVNAGEKLYIGYTCTGSQPVCYSDQWNANGCWTKDGDGMWTDRANLGQYSVNSLSIRAKIENANFLKDLALVSLDEVEASPRRTSTLTGKVKSTTPATVGNYELTVKLEGEVFTKETVTETFNQAFQEKAFEIELPAVDEALKSKLEVTITAVNGAPDAAEGNNTQTCVYKNSRISYPRNVVVEEGTGTWCQYCVRGLVGMEYMANKYPDRFIGIGVHDNDAFAVNAYYGLIIGLGGLPSCKQNRLEKFDPASDTLEEQFNACGTRADGQVTLLGAEYDDATKSVTAYANGRICYNIHKNADYRIVFVVTENGVPAMQSNAYSGGRYGPMGGFENKSNPCYVELPDVARAIAPTYLGKKGSMPAVLEVDKDYNYSCTFTLPSETGDRSKLTLIAMLLDGETGEILNATKMPMNEAVVTGIETSEVKKPSAKGAYDLSGRKVTDFKHGIVIVNGKKILK